MFQRMIHAHLTALLQHSLEVSLLKLLMLSLFLVQLTLHLQQQMPVQSKVGTGDHPLTMPPMFKILHLRLDQLLHSERDGTFILLVQRQLPTLPLPNHLTSHLQLWTESQPT